MARIRAICPKCESEGAWYEQSGNDVWLRCLCGFCKVVESRVDDKIVITHVEAEEIMIPRRGSMLYLVFAALASLRVARLHDIVEEVNRGKKQRDCQSASDIASRLTVLRLKGLAEVVEERKGKAGGSTWKATEVVYRLLAKEC